MLGGSRDYHMGVSRVFVVNGYFSSLALDKCHHKVFSRNFTIVTEKTRVLRKCSEKPNIAEPC